MSRKTGGRVAKPKLCAFCGGKLVEARPPYLVVAPRGTIIGPYHAGCAEKIVLLQKHGGQVAADALEGGKPYGTAGREETLPW